MSIVLNGTGGTISGVPGQVLQVVNANITGSVSTNTGSMTATPLTATITPSSTSSKILIFMTCSLYISRGSNSDVGSGVAIYRNGSSIYTDNDNYVNFYYSSTSVGNIRNRTPMQFLDSPNSTSAQTYTLYIACYPSSGSSIALNTDSQSSFITLMEISA